MKIYLARHGQNEDNLNGILNGHRDLPLTDLGRKQAITAGENILKLGLKFETVYSSPLQRALETAVIMSNISGNPEPKVYPLLIERDFGVMSGKPVTQIKELCAPDIIETDTITYFLSPDGAETFPELIVRAKQVLSELGEKHKNDDILLVGHGDMGKMIYAAYYDLPWLEVLTKFHFGNSELLLLSAETSPDNAHLFFIEQFNH